jgi:hypothetical protein
MKYKNALGWVLILFGSFSLLFGWPWGSLVGAIIVLAGVIALKSPESAKLQHPEIPPSPPLHFPESSKVQLEAERLASTIRAMETRGEPVPEDMIDRLKVLADSALDDLFRDYDAFIARKGDQSVDFGLLLQEFRNQHGSSDESSEQLKFVLKRIEELGGKVPLVEAISLQAIIDPDGAQAHYLQERQRRGNASLYANEPHLEWESNPGFYERQLQRRHHNVFFPPHKQRVSQHDLYIARQLDEKERNSFWKEWKEFSEEVLKSIDGQNLNLIYALMEKAVSIGLDNGTVEHLHKMYQAVLIELQEFLNGDPTALKTLESAEQERWADKWMILNPAMAQIRRLPDKADVLPMLLSEDTETIRAAMEVLDASEVESLRSFVLQGLKESEFGQLLQKQPMKLEALGIKTPELKPS